MSSSSSRGNRTLRSYSCEHGLTKQKLYLLSLTPNKAQTKSNPCEPIKPHTNHKPFKTHFECVTDFAYQYDQLKFVSEYHLTAGDVKHSCCSTILFLFGGWLTITFNYDPCKTSDAFCIPFMNLTKFLESLWRVPDCRSRLIIKRVHCPTLLPGRRVVGRKVSLWGNTLNNAPTDFFLNYFFKFPLKLHGPGTG